jgi:hypothetical protein
MVAAFKDTETRLAVRWTAHFRQFGAFLPLDSSVFHLSAHEQAGLKMELQKNVLVFHYEAIGVRDLLLGLIAAVAIIAGLVYANRYVLKRRRDRKPRATTSRR